MKDFVETGMSFHLLRNTGISGCGLVRAFNQLWTVLFVAALSLWSGDAWAAAASIGDLICNVKNNASVYPFILNAGAYIVGLFMGVKAILLFKKHVENPAQPQVTAATAQLLMAGALMALPSLVAIIQKSIMGNGVGGAGDFGCNAKGIATGANTLDIMMQNFVTNVHGPIFKLISIIAVMVGLTFIVKALLAGAKTGTDPRASDPKAIITSLVIGSILISTGTILPGVLQTLFGDNKISQMTNINLIAWSKITGNSSATFENADKTVSAILAFIQVMGGISFLRGWLKLKTALDGGQATVPQAATHILGGAMAINIDKMLEIFDKTFGTGIINAK